MATLSNISGGSHEAVAANPANAPKGANGVTLIDAKNAVVVDSQGRAIKVRKSSAIDKMRLLRVVGAADSDNAAFMNYATLASMVTEIDSLPCTPIASMLDIEAMVQRLEEYGLEAVLNARRYLVRTAGVSDNMSP